MNPMRRRTALQIGAGAFLAPLISARAKSAESSTESTAEKAHAEIWRRFVDRRFDTLLHYTGLHGEVVFPTAEECAASQPNGMSWSMPIEDGPFFGGLFLDGLINRWRARRDAESAEKVRRIAFGLVKLAEASPLPGFIPRGLGEDGKSFYPASSEDQVFPWFYGLWCYLRTDLPSPAEREQIVKHLVATVRAIEGHGWRVPCVRPEFGFRGDFTRPTAHDAARFLFLLRAMSELTGEPRWMEECHRRLPEKIGPKQVVRADVLAAGLEYIVPGGESFVWTHAMSQAALRALADDEKDSETREIFQRGLRASAERVLPHLDRAKRYDPANKLAFDSDWRFLKDSWKPQANCDEAIALARHQLTLWAEHNPRSPYEDDTVREPLFAAWIVLLSGDAELFAAHGPRIREMLRQYEWSGLYTSTFFAAVNVHYESARPRPK